MTRIQDPGAAQSYAARVSQHVPALQELHQMTGLLLAEHVPEAGRVLVLGAGGGLELRALAERHAGWRFDGVDPSGLMLDQARQTVADFADRITLQEGYIDSADAGPFDGAVCLLTLHFLPRDKRLWTLQEIARRLPSGAPLVVAHHSFALADGQQDVWLRRNAALLVARGVPESQAMQGIEALRTRLPVLSPDEDEALLRAAGFEAVQMFFAAFTFKGWVAMRA